MRIRERTAKAVSSWIGFMKRQPNEWVITATRTSIYRFFYQMVLPYLSIYTLSLGASGLQLGLVNSLGIGVAGILGPLTGWIIDRVGYKAVYLVGISLLAVSWFLYAIAQSWEIIIVGMLAYWVGLGTSMHSCSVICGNSLANEDRATAMSVCESLAAGLLGMLGPMVGAFLVVRFGGVNVEGIRPLFYICLVGTIGTFFFVLFKLPNPKRPVSAKKTPNLFKGLSEVFAYRRSVKRFLAISSIVFLPQGMVIPFAQAFAREVKGADPYTLGAMVTGFALTPFLLGIPIGRIADRFGRKRVLLAIAPVVWASNLMLIWAPSSAYLILSGTLQGFIYINSIITMAMMFELFPAEFMGRWMGINRFFRMTLAAVSAYAAGFIWDTIGPAYLFIAFIGIDLLIRIPLLISVAETKGMKHAQKVS